MSTTLEAIKQTTNSDRSNDASIHQGRAVDDNDDDKVMMAVTDHSAVQIHHRSEANGGHQCGHDDDPSDIHMSSSSTDSSTVQSSNQTRRPRTNSSLLPSSSNNNNTDVQSVVTKAKRASASLWMLLHAKSCRLGVNSCRYRGCHEAKLVLLHMKTCTAATDAMGHHYYPNNNERNKVSSSSSSPCPTHYNGCEQARKLLAHYKTCREIRLRQNNTIHEVPSSAAAPAPAPAAPSPPPQNHFCLVCSLVARQARNVLNHCSNDIDSTNVIINGQKKHQKYRARFASFDDADHNSKTKPTLLMTASTTTATTKIAPLQKIDETAIHSGISDNENPVSTLPEEEAVVITPSPGTLQMPPPPPRRNPNQHHALAHPNMLMPNSVASSFSNLTETRPSTLLSTSLSSSSSSVIASSPLMSVASIAALAYPIPNHHKNPICVTTDDDDDDDLTNCMGSDDHNDTSCATTNTKNQNYYLSGSCDHPMASPALASWSSGSSWSSWGGGYGGHHAAADGGGDGDGRGGHSLLGYSVANGGVASEVSSLPSPPTPKIQNGKSLPVTFHPQPSRMILPRRRKRAESLDVSALLSAAQPLLALRHSSSSSRSHHNNNDPTLELDLTTTTTNTTAKMQVASYHLTDATIENDVDDNTSSSSSLMFKRPRSLSCGVIMMGRSNHSLLKAQTSDDHVPLSTSIGPAPSSSCCSSSSNNPCCETIMEEASHSSKESNPSVSLSRTGPEQNHNDHDDVPPPVQVSTQILVDETETVFPMDEEIIS